MNIVNSDPSHIRMPLRISGLLNTNEEVCGTAQLHHWHRETWWWNEHVENAIAAKGKAFKARKNGKGTRASYNAAKCIPRHAVHHAHQEANKKINENVDPKSSEVYPFANQFKRENPDVVGDKPMKNDAGEMSMFVLRFYGPVNPMGSCRAWSVYLTTRLLGRLSPLSG